MFIIEWVIGANPRISLYFHLNVDKKNSFYHFNYCCSPPWTGLTRNVELHLGHPFRQLDLPHKLVWLCIHLSNWMSLPHSSSIPFSLTSISFPQTLVVISELELPKPLTLFNTTSSLCFLEKNLFCEIILWPLMGHVKNYKRRKWQIR